jgi:hypothetical protein
MRSEILWRFMPLSHKLKLTVYWMFALLYLSGAGFWLFDHFFTVETSLGTEHHPLQIWTLRLHGILAVPILILLGYVLRAHVQTSWRARNALKKMGKGSNQQAGIFLSYYLLVLVLTVPGLMYLTNETLKDWTEAVHTYLGLLLLLPFAWHVYLRYRQS